MRQLSFKHTHPVWYPEDVAKMQTLLADIGYHIDERTCQAAWEEYSDSMCAGWLFLPDTGQEIFDCIEPYVEVGEELSCTIQ